MITYTWCQFELDLRFSDIGRIRSAPMTLSAFRAVFPLSKLNGERYRLAVGSKG